MANDIQLAASATSALTESDIRVNYNNLRQYVGGVNQSGGMLVFASNNAGANWSATTLPLAPGQNLLSDPTFDWTSDGTAWALAIAYSNDSSGNPTNLQVASFRSTNATSASPTWTFDSIVSGTQKKTDKASLWVDRTPTSPFKDNMYAIWHNGVQAFVARRAGPSGAWQTPVQVSGSETSFTSDGGDVKTNQSGDVFAFWPNAGGQTLLVAKSTNGGANFGSPVQIATTLGKFEIGIPAQNIRRVLIYITAGAFRTANEDLVFAAWMDLAGGDKCNAPGREPGSNAASDCKSRIWFSRSTNGGANWSTPVKINDQGSKNDQFHPRMTIDEITGELVIIYYDTVNDPVRVKADVWMQRSADFGASWSGTLRITSAATDETSAGADVINQFGDYIGMTGHSGQFFGCWTDRRSGKNEEIWGAPLRDTPVEYLAGIAANHSINVYRYDPSTNWTAGNIPWASMVGPLTSWVVGDVWHLAGVATDQNLYVLWQSPGRDWQAANISQMSGQTVVGSVTSWIHGTSEFIAGIAANHSINVYRYDPSTNWTAGNIPWASMVGPLTSWVVGDVWHLAGVATDQNLYVLWQSPGRDWQAANISQITEVQVSGAMASWVVDDVEHLAGHGVDGSVYVFWYSPVRNWQAANVSEITGFKITSPLAPWWHR